MSSSSSPNKEKGKVISIAAILISVAALAVSVVSLCQSSEHTRFEETRDRLDRIERHWEDIYQDVQVAKREGYTVIALEQQLDEAEELISQALTTWLEGDSDEANNLILDSNSIIKAVQQELEEMRPPLEALQLWILLPGVLGGTILLLLVFLLIRITRRRAL